MLKRIRYLAEDLLSNHADHYLIFWKDYVTFMKKIKLNYLV
jgi:hypothetical protein